MACESGRATRGGGEWHSHGARNFRSNTGVSFNRRQAEWSDNRAVTSFMFCEFPEEVDTVNIWWEFKKYGEVVDLFISRRRLRKGARFGFVRFRNVSNKDEFLNHLNKIKFGACRIRAYPAFNRRKRSEGANMAVPPSDRYPISNVSHGVRDGRSYKEVAAGGANWNGSNCQHAEMVDREPDIVLAKTQEMRTIEVDLSTDRVETMRGCIIGEIKNVELLESLPSICKAEGLTFESIKYMGGKDLLINLGTHAAVESLISNINHGIRNWLWTIREWDPS